MPPTESTAIILFDGVCNFCCSSVQFIIARDPAQRFTFASQQSDRGKQLLADAKLPPSMDTFVLIENGIVYTRSTAALKVATRLTPPWPLFTVFRIVPTFIRDAAYRVIAQNRYRWFGKKETCWIPTPEIRARFLS
jgi:predicted DCC family thiol-disulfide oxidoreductase YuxK